MNESLESIEVEIQWVPWGSCLCVCRPGFETLSWQNVDLVTKSNEVMQGRV